MNAQDRQDEIVKGYSRQITRWLRHVARRLPAKQREIAFLQPGDDGVVESRRSLVDCPRSEPGPPRPPAPANQHRVAGHRLHAGLSLPGLEVFRENPRSWLEVRHAFQSGDVIQHRTRHDSTFHGEDGIPGSAALFGHEACNRIPVPHLPAEESVRERIEVGRAGPVDAGVRHSIGRTRVARRDHRPLDRARHVDVLFREGIRCQRHRHAFFDEGRRRFALGRRN